MNRPNGTSRELPKNVGSSSSGPAGVYRGSGSAAVYRSLEVPLQQPGPLSLNRNAPIEKGHPSLFGPVASQHGEAMWHSQAKAKLTVEPKEVRPHPLPLIVATGGYTVLKLQGDPVSSVVSEVHRMFERYDVDYEFMEQEFSWTCMSYSNHVETRFICKLYSVPDPNQKNFFLLDFQRLSGDCQHFYSIHKSMNIELVKSGYSISCPEDKKLLDEKPMIRSFKPLALPIDYFADDDIVEEKDGKEYEPLCAMCTSQFIDVQREGLKTLASQLDQSSVARECLQSFSSKLFELFSLTRDVQVRRLAVTSLACLLKDGCCQSKFDVRKDQVDLLVKTLSDEQEIPETRRQCAKVLHSLLRLSHLSAQVKSSCSGIQKLSVKDSRLGELIRLL